MGIRSVRRLWFLFAPLALLPLAVTPVARAESSGGQRYPVVDTQYIYDQVRYMSDNFHNRISGGDGDPRTGVGNLPPAVNGWQEFYAYWKQQVTSPAVMGSWASYLSVRDHYFKSDVFVGGGAQPPNPSDVREVT